MNYQRLEAQIREDEGLRLEPYLDSVGVPTIGYGCTSIMGEPVSMRTAPITEKVARLLMRSSLYTALLDAEHCFPRLPDLDPVRAEVIVNMAYNLGRYGLHRFTRMRKAVERGDFGAAADEMIDSRWHEQVGHRAERLERQMRTGEY